MADAASRRSVRAATGEGWPARAALVAVGAAFLLLFVAMPLVWSSPKPSGRAMALTSKLFRDPMRRPRCA